MITRLSKFDIKHDPEAENTLKVMVTAVEAGGVRGLSQNSSFIKTEVTMAFALVDENGKELASLQATAKGLGGSVSKSAAQGIDNVKIEKDIKPLLAKMCSAKNAAPNAR